MKFTTGDFGILVISAAIFAAGNLGLPEFLLADSEFARISPGVIASPFVASLGIPTIIGLTLGQFIASTASPIGTLDLLSPVVGLVGLSVIYVMRRRATIVGCLIYVIVTSAWLSYMAMAAGGIPFGQSVQLTFGAQLISVMVGYALYIVAKRAGLFGRGKTEHAVQETVAPQPPP